jgi:hypothetical protein
MGLHIAFGNCFIAGASRTILQIFYGSLVCAFPVLLWLVVRRLRMPDTPPAWKVALISVFFVFFLAGVLALGALGLVRAAIYLTATEPASRSTIVDSRDRIKGCRALIGFYDSSIRGAASACASDFGFEPRVGDRIRINELISPLGVRILSVRQISLSSYFNGSVLLIAERKRQKP